MIAELVDNNDDCFSFKENLIALVSLTDILKLNKISINCNYDELQENDENLDRLCINRVKLHITPWLDNMIITCLNTTSSEKHILNYLYSNDIMKISSFLTMNEIFLKVSELMDNVQGYELLNDHNTSSVVHRFKEFNLILRLLSRCHDLAQSELIRAFKIYRDIEGIQRDTHSKFELIGGIIYFLAVICFEAFTPGLNEFLRVCLSDLREIFEYDPSLLYWIPELDLMHTVLALHNRSDQTAIDDLLKLSIFEIHSLKPTFKDIVINSLALLDFDERILFVKLIQKYGNTNIIPEFMNSFCMIKTHKSNFAVIKNESELDDFNDRIDLNSISFDYLNGQNSDFPVSNQWMADLVYHLKHSRE